jgi:ABC-type nickel/cobalt efflux system permease component RcnA
VRIWHGRHAAPLVVLWTAVVVIAALLYKAQDVQPALIDLLRPLYIIVGIAALLLTWKWFRERKGGKAHDRRHADRRHSERRDDEESE